MLYTGYRRNTVAGPTVPALLRKGHDGVQAPILSNFVIYYYCYHLSVNRSFYQTCFINDK